jgi:hypothetical protein
MESPEQSYPETLSPLSYHPGDTPVDNFANASFHPDLIKVMQSALAGAVSTLPHPVNSNHVQSIAQTILRSANEGEQDSVVLQRIALMELQISPRN